MPTLVQLGSVTVTVWITGVVETTRAISWPQAAENSTQPQRAKPEKKLRCDMLPPEVHFCQAIVPNPADFKARASMRSHMMDKPPSAIKVAPVMKDASSEASHTIGQAISCGSAQRPIKELPARSVLSCSGDLPAATARPM